ncbi:MAG: hypothetical protein K2Y31_14815 [Burkholderiales bacterium]|jgi:hypothetical protein|nr:hypothetical protein [Burkholderiales bacterium]
MNTVPQNPADTHDPGHSAAATLQLMSHYARRPCPLLAHAIAEQLARLSQSCSDGSSLALQKLANTLMPQWQHIACGNAVQH